MTQAQLGLLVGGLLPAVLFGFSGVFFALLAFTMPGMTIAFLVIYWSVYVLIDGLFSLVASFKGGTPAPRWWLILSGILSIIAGGICIANPAIATATFILILGWFCLFKGVLELLGGLAAKSGLFTVGGILSLLFGAWCLSDPLTVAELILKLIAAFALLAGTVFITLSLKLRTRAKGLPRTIDI